MSSTLQFGQQRVATPDDESVAFQGSGIPPAIRGRQGSSHPERAAQRRLREHQIEPEWLRI
jgi:hypothetical protein